VEPYLLDLLMPANNGVLLDIYPGQVPPFMSDPYNSLPRSFTALSSGVLFSAFNPTNGRELWKTDGTVAGTVLFQDINLGTGDSNPDNFNVLGSQLTFAATHNTLGRELFKTTGNTGSLVLIRDINAAGDSNPNNVKNVNGILYFSADNGSVGQELWKSNGFNSGTTLVKDINPSGNSNPSKFFQFGTEVYFTADDGTNGVELWKTNGTSGGTTLVKNINPAGNGNPDYFTEYNGKLYFTANDGTNGTELWVTDGTTVGTTMLELNPVGDATVTNLIVFNNELYMAADAGDGIGQELWAYQDPTLSVDDNQLNGEKVSLYPNPTQNYFQIETTETLSKVEIYSLHGQLVKSFVPQNQYDISNLSSGIYLVKIQANDGEITKRLIKE
jgi:ELWxxDGT repeat protein